MREVVAGERSAARGQGKGEISVTQEAGKSAEVNQSMCESIETSLRGGRALPLMRMLQFKTMLKAALPVEQAFKRYQDIVAPGPALALRRQRAVPQFRAAREQAVEMKVLHPGGEQVELGLPKITGEADAQPIKGTTRKVFYAAFENATAYARSTTIRLSDGRFAFDLYPGDLGSMPVDAAWDPVVFHQEDERVWCIDDQRQTQVLKLPTAISVLGADSMSFGHWMVEELWRFLALRRIPGGDKLPILIDAGIPEQHRQSIEAFAGPDQPIVEVPRFMRVEVGRLWICSNWFYSPKMLLTDVGLDTSPLVFPSKPLSVLLKDSWAELDDKLGRLPEGDKIFVSRDADRHRSITNQDDVTQFLTDRGYREVRPETLSFTEQFRLYRSCSDIVIQTGSAMSGLILCAPGTRVTFLTHRAIPLNALWSQGMMDLGADVQILTGPFGSFNETYTDKSSYRIDLDQLAAVLDQ